jgi:hypothetical protein
MVSPGQLDNSVDLPPPDEIDQWVPLGRAGSLQDIAPGADCSVRSSAGCRVHTQGREPTVSSEGLRFTEIEHKFVVDGGFDLPRFREQLASLGPTRTSAVAVRDRYYLTEGGHARRVLFRHRFDAELHHLTVKRLEADPEVRLEVNLDLGHHQGSQDAQVDAFLGQLGVIWQGTLHKALEV